MFQRQLQCEHPAPAGDVHHAGAVADEQRIAVAADIHGFDGSWALGAMVYEIAQGSGQYGLVGEGGIVVAGALLVGLVVGGLRRAGWACPLSTYVRLY